MLYRVCIVSPFSLLTSSVQQNPPWESDIYSASQKLSAFLKSKCHYCSQEPANDQYPKSDESSPEVPFIFYEDLFQYFPPIYAQVFRVFAPIMFPTKISLRHKKR